MEFGHFFIFSTSQKKEMALSIFQRYKSQM